MPIKAPTLILSTVIDLDTTYYDASTIQEYVGQYYDELGNFTDTAVYAESLGAIAVS